LFFLERVEASSGLSFFVTFLDKQKSLKEKIFVSGACPVPTCPGQTCRGGREKSKRNDLFKMLDGIIGS
jgi:hypothetical protein